MPTTPTKDDKLSVRSAVSGEGRPVISEAWQKMFNLEPQLHQPNTAPFFDKEEFRVRGGRGQEVKGIYEYMLSGLEDEW